MVELGKNTFQEIMENSEAKLIKFLKSGMFSSKALGWSARLIRIANLEWMKFHGRILS